MSTLSLWSALTPPPAAVQWPSAPVAAGIAIFLLSVATLLIVRFLYLPGEDE